MRTAHPLSSFASLDVALFRWANEVAHSPLFDAFFLWLTKPPYRVVLFLLLWGALMVWGGRKGRRAGILLIFVVLAADQLSSSLIKPWIDRVRPCFALDGVRLLLPRQAHSGSFPSSHAVNSFAVAVVLFSVRRWLGWVAIGVAILVSYSRIYVGVHYPSDSVGGAILGALVAWAGLRLADVVVGRIAQFRRGADLPG